MPYIQVRDLRMHYQQVGPADGSEVVLIHGVTGNLAVWMLSGLMKKLSAQFRVTAYDMRGHGRSDTPDDSYTSADMSDDFAALHTALGLRPAFLLGHSFGGAVALHAAARHSELVAGAILSDPFVPALHHLQVDPRRWKGFRAYKDNAATAGMIIDGNLWNLKEMLHQAANLSARRRKMFVDRAGEAALLRLERLAPTTCGEDVAQAAGLDEEQMARVEQPMVCLRGENSPFLPMCDALAQILPNCVTDVIPDAQHFGFEENPIEFVDRVERQFCAMANRTPTAPSLPLEQRRQNVMTDT